MNEPARPPRDTPASKPKALLALLLLIPAPTLGTLFGLGVVEAGPEWLGQSVYFGAKAWLLALPLVWHLFVDHGPISWSPPRTGKQGRADWVVAVVSGLVITAIIFAAYALLGRHLIDEPTREHVRTLAAGNGLDDWRKYLFLAAYITVINALLEEYVWRWFVYTRFRAFTPQTLAIVLAALAFGVHHYVALAVQFGHPLAVLGTLGVCIGGAWWSWMYAKQRSVWPAYLSHAIVDIPVFVIGAWIIFG
ncbi:MAG: type II CAAX endopeptidase family protein [Planctomycetota bacterium]